jgi:SAM-dependent methyltransferase
MKSIQNSGTSVHPRQSFIEWYHSSTPGKLLRQCEADYLLGSIQLTYNQKILQVGRLESENSYIVDDFRNNFAIVEGSCQGARPGYSHIISLTDELPIANESIDLLILPHVLEFEDNPQQVLREAERILKPEGTIYLLAFNPWSVRGMVRRLPRRDDFKMKNNIAWFKLMEWLRALKMEAEFSAGFGLASSQTIFKPDSLLTRSMAQLANAYAVKAIKRSYNFIPMRPTWSSAPTLVPGQIAETPTPLMHEPWTNE